MRTVWTWLAIGGAILAVVGLLAVNYRVTSLKEANPKLKKKFVNDLLRSEPITVKHDPPKSLTPDGKETLRRQAAWLRQYSDVMVQVEGHADERGTREYNISLSARRATTTREFLVAQGVEKSRISSIAYGKERPAALCDAEECWSKNRRTVTVITSGAKTS